MDIILSCLLSALWFATYPSHDFTEQCLPSQWEAMYCHRWYKSEGQSMIHCCNYQQSAVLDSNCMLCPISSLSNCLITNFQTLIVESSNNISSSAHLF